MSSTMPKKPKKMTKHIAPPSVLVLPAVVLCGVFCFTSSGCHKDAPQDSQGNAQTSVVETTAVHPQQVVDRLDIPARVAPDPERVVHVYSQISGQLAELLIRPGQEVSKGQTIGRIQSSEIAQARSDYEKAKIEVTRSDAQLRRAKELLQHDVLAQRDYDDMLATSQAAHSELIRNEQRIKMLGFSVQSAGDSTSLKSPITGTVIDIGTASGELQRSLDNASAIATIANLDEVWVLGDVYERDLATVKTGRPVDITFTAYPGEVFHGTITNVSDAIDPTSLTLKARVVLKNPGHRFKPLMYASFSIQRSSEQAFVIPQKAVIHQGATSFVFVESAPGKYEKRTVTTGAAQGQNVVVSSGLKDGDKIVTTGAALLRAPAGA